MVLRSAVRILAHGKQVDDADSDHPQLKYTVERVQIQNTPAGMIRLDMVLVLHSKKPHMGIQEVLGRPRSRVILNGRVYEHVDSSCDHI